MCGILEGTVIYFEIYLVHAITRSYLLECCQSCHPLHHIYISIRRIFSGKEALLHSRYVLWYISNVSFAWLKAVICLHRNVSSKDHKLVYWLAGGMAGASVLFEKKNRRSELALYVLPRAGDSLWNILVNRHLLPNVKNAEVCYFFISYMS